MARKKYERHNPWVYAAYKGEEFLCEGTKEEICASLGIKLATFQFYRTNYYKKNRFNSVKIYKKHKESGLVIVRIDGKDKIWNDEEKREERI